MTGLLLLAAGGSAATAPGTALAGSSAYDHDSQVMSVNQPDWMAPLPDSTPLGRMSIPGTHDSMAIHGGIAYQAQSLCGTGASADSSNTSPCDPTAQLNAGIRFLDIRLKCTGLDTRALGVYHGSGAAGDQHADFSSNVLAKVQQFLTSHPTETVLLEVSNEGDDLSNSCAYNPNPSTYASPFEYQFSKDVASYPNLLWKPPCPPYCSAQSAGVSSYSVSLGEVRGHVVPLPRFTTRDQFRWGIPWNGYSPPPGTSGSGFNPLVIQDNYDVCEIVIAGCSEDFNQKVKDVEAQAKTASMADSYHFSVNFLSGSTHAIPYRVACGTPCSTAEDGVNPSILAWLQSPSANGVLPLGIMAMDFPGVDLISAITARNAVQPGLRVVNAPWDGSGIYLVDIDGTLRHIPDPATYTNLFGPDESTNVLPRHLNGIPHGPDLSSDAHLATQGDGRIYLVTNGQKRWITSPSVFDQFGFSAKRVLTAPPGALDAYPDGPDLT